MKIDDICSRIGGLDLESVEEASRILFRQAKPRGSLGKLEEIASKVCGIRGTTKPEYKNKVILTMAGDHGVTEEGVSAFPSEVTVQMIHGFVRGGAGVNVLGRHVGANVKVVDMGVAGDLSELANTGKIISKNIAKGTKNFTKGPAMSREEAERSVIAGFEIVEELAPEKIDMLGVGDMGIGNTTPSSAIVAVYSGVDVSEVTGRGTGIDDETLYRKIDVIKRGIEFNKPNKDDPIDVLAKVGGFEIGGIAGAVLSAAANRIPVLLDGLISSTGGLIAAEIAPDAKNFMFASHLSVERGHKFILERLNLQPLLKLNMRLGEGTGAALGMNIVEASIKILREMMTFKDGKVSEEK